MYLTSYADQKQTSEQRTRLDIKAYPSHYLTRQRPGRRFERLGAIHQQFERRRQRAAAVERPPRVRRDVRALPLAERHAHHDLGLCPLPRIFRDDPRQLDQFAHVAQEVDGLA